MTEQDRVTVNDPRGPVNNGAGHQYVFYGISADWMIRKGVESLRITREDRVRLADRFVPPVGYRIAARRLEKPGSMVLLEAQPGSGRRAAAIMLLHGFSEEGGTGEESIRFEELPITSEDENRLAPGRGDRFLLDLSGIADEEAYRKAQRRLAVHRSQVQEKGAHMVVVLPWGMEHAHPADLVPHTVRLRRPRGIAVVTRHLRMDLMPFRTTDLGNAALRQLCDRSPMRELARLAGLVRAARDSGRFGADFGSWLDQAMHAVTDRAGEVGRQMTAVHTTPDRALLLATAMFEEVRADIVYEAWHGLLKTVGHQEEATTELGRMDFGKRLERLGIERDPDARLRFERLAYADAVRTYFWANFPGVRDDLRDWIDRAAGLHGLTTDDRVNLVVRFGERALAAERPDHLFALATRWADRATGTPSNPLAVAALEFGLGHERFGGWFRKRIRECVARSGPLSDSLARVLTTVCVQNLSATHPDQAVVRLHYLAARHGEAAREAREALLHLVGHDGRLYRLLIDRLRDRVRREPHKAEPHLQLLTELLMRERAPDPPPWPDLSAGWEAVFSEPPTELWNPLVSGWLNAVAGDSTQMTALDVMVGATRSRTAALHRLYTIACGWARSARHPSRASVAARFWQRIDHVQYGRTERADAGPRAAEEAR
ncbi:MULTISPECIES: hypothetical protein [unclassified Streptomyces]|uniref:hypothetical protein n=1 Tax=unclassified Streptomyces TaxID=2593676 RepID=UPI0016606594|nr:MULTISPECIES: hypothetical protein [unclassified Streptomyces]MBD0706868.1 hypothetical protein [Streptomyces sp. CBMA291]MBD0715004.1 hypothetical protein [Streptomyces sp. CBMA370]